MKNIPLLSLVGLALVTFSPGCKIASPDRRQDVSGAGAVGEGGDQVGLVNTKRIIDNLHEQSKNRYVQTTQAVDVLAQKIDEVHTKTIGAIEKHGVSGWELAGIALVVGIVVIVVVRGEALLRVLVGACCAVRVGVKVARRQFGTRGISRGVEGHGLAR